MTSLNANRALIAEEADNKGSVYGVFYAGIALFGAAGAFVSGMIWEYFDAGSVLAFSLGGTAFLVFLFLFTERTALSSIPVLTQLL